MLIICLSILIVALASGAESTTATTTRLLGKVTDTTGRPLAGATVIVLKDGLVLTGIATDADGSFDFHVENSGGATLQVRVSSVGYHTRTIQTIASQQADEITISLSEKMVTVGLVTVSPTHRLLERSLTLQRQTVAAAAEASLVPTNPIAALKQPSVSRAGSAHSSQIRVHGTSPVYYLNGMPIGTDPTHYGLFAIIPSSVIDQISFHPMGSPAEYRLATVVGFNTAKPFGRKSRGEMILSTVEATGSFSVANERYYAVGSVRKSVLDHLVQYLNVSSDRATLPPTNFQDVFASVGVKLTPGVQLMFDHYQVRDYLSYNTGAVTNSGIGINTFQSSQENLYAMHLVGHSSRSLVKATAALRTGRRRYRAEPSGGLATSGICVDISERYTVAYTRLQATIALGNSELTTGFEAEFDSPREQSLNQQNWNFLPPFSNTDNPYVYQQALNESYGNYQSVLKSSSRATYVSMATNVGPWSIVSGLRFDQFSPLRDGNCLTVRASATTMLGPETQIRAVYGSFASTPLDNILEPYQILIRADLDRLSPIRTSLISLDLAHHFLTLNLFHKRLDKLPILVPDFGSLYTADGDLLAGFLTVRSVGAARFSGGSIAAEQPHLGGGPISLTASYAYTRAYQIDHALMMPHELHSPHRVRLGASYEPSPRLTLGAELTARSGYPYSPIRQATTSDETAIYTNSYYASVRAAENSLRFATSAGLNLRLRYQVGRIDLMLSLSNITNRANPIINASSGQIYDAGIMPMLGLKYQL